MKATTLRDISFRTKCRLL